MSEDHDQTELSLPSDLGELETRPMSPERGAALGTDALRQPSRRHGFRPGELVTEHLEVVRPLGSGGMGEVFVARDRKLGRRVAIKTLKLPAGASPKKLTRFIQLFERDAASTAQLNHPCIVTIFQFGEHAGYPFFVLELVDGKPLDSVLDGEGALSESEVLSLGMQLCEALSYAHDHGVVHRDIKPANLMRTRDGRLKVLDFGVALIRKARDELEDAFGSSSAQLESRLGEEPRAAGTPAYMAPEQMMGLEQDARVDVWATGVTLYELLVGSRPSNRLALLAGAAPPTWPEELECSGSTRRAIERCLIADPGERMGSMRELADALGEALEAQARPALVVAPRRRTNLVPMQDAFVGRARELAALDELVFDEDHKWVTLVGPGGVGKTRLITEWGVRALERDSVDDVVLCTLTEARDARGVLFALGDALGVPLTQDDPVAQLGYVLEKSHGLVLILDNCEQVAQPIAELFGRWSPGLGGIEVVATSRVALSVVGEQLVQLEPLEDTAHAVELYTERARQVRPGWSCPEEQRGALEELVEELDRLPLAIELAAARVKVLGPEKMLGRIAQRFKVLRSSKRGVSDRQATLEGAIAWSWDLLGDGEKSAMAQMSVFEGGFTLEAAEEVVVLSDTADVPFVLDVVEQLVGASLLRYADDGEHFSMLVSVRAFALEQLARTGREDETRARHAAWFARWDLDAVERDRARGFPEIALEAEDLDAASAWGLQPGRGDEALGHGLTCTAALASFTELAGPFSMTDVLEARVRAHQEVDSVQMTHVIGRLGWLDRLRGEAESAREKLERAIDAAYRAGDERGESIWRGCLSYLEREQGRAEQAQGQLERALELSRKLGDSRNEGVWMSALGFLARERRDPERARTLIERGLAIARRHDDSRGEGFALGALGFLEREQGRPGRARELIEQAIEVSRRLGDPRGEGVSLSNLGVLEREQGNLERARELIEQALHTARRLGDIRSEGIAMGQLGTLERDQGNMARAAGLLERAIESARRLGDPRAEGVWMNHMGVLEERRGGRERARQWFEQSLAIATQLGDARAEALMRGHLERLAAEEDAE